jgi:hypothetical protein
LPLAARRTALGLPQEAMMVSPLSVPTIVAGSPLHVNARGAGDDGGGGGSGRGGGGGGGTQKGLKLMAASTSYGVAAEIIVEEREYEREAILYAYQTKRMRHKTMEKPGKYFNGIIAPLIPAGGRLLLAIAERLARDRGLDYVLCDTDSMSFERPAGMDRETFHSHVKDVTDWFQPLLPYASGRLFEMESQNWGLADGKPVDGQWEPLYCLAVSSKRYALYNLVDGEVIIRKFSAHGTGDMVNPPIYESKTPEPVEGLLYDCGPMEIRPLVQRNCGYFEIQRGGNQCAWRIS